MTNKIQGYGPQLPVTAGGAKTGAVERAGGDAPKVEAVVPAAGDSVKLTDAARQLQRLAEAVAAAPEVDAARVAELRRAIAEGTYEVDAERVADRLLAANRELPGR